MEPTIRQPNPFNFTFRLFHFSIDFFIYQSAADSYCYDGYHGHFPPSDAVGQTTEEVSRYQITARGGNENGSQLPSLGFFK